MGDLVNLNDYRKRLKRRGQSDDGDDRSFRDNTAVKPSASSAESSAKTMAEPAKVLSQPTKKASKSSGPVHRDSASDEPPDAG